MSGYRAAGCIVFVLLPICAVAAADGPPALDCRLGFEGLRAAAAAQSGAPSRTADGFEIIDLPDAGSWGAEYVFTTPGHNAHPTVSLRIRRKQVTGVWTVDRKRCGYGTTDRFERLMAQFKTLDRDTTNASRAEVERDKQASPLGVAP